jgi:transposase
MGYRELHRMEIEEVIRRWQAGESQRAIARATGVARETVKKYLVAAISLGLSATGPPPSDALLIELRRLGVVATQPAHRLAPRMATLEQYREQIATWLDYDHLPLTRIQELLLQDGVTVTYTTLRRFVRQAGLWKQPRSTVRMAPSVPGEVAEMDFGKLGTLVNPITGTRQVVYGLLVVLVYSRHAFVWPLLQQTVEATIEGLEQAWRFFGALPQRLVLDNFPAAVAGPDALNPRPTRAFLEYSQARGLLLDPARVRSPATSPTWKPASSTYESVGGRAAASKISPMRVCKPSAGAEMWLVCAYTAPPAVCRASSSRMKNVRTCDGTTARPTTYRSGAR